MSPARMQISDADSSTRLAVYLRDHLAGATAGLQLARRALGNNRGTELEPVLERLVGEIGEDRATLQRLMRHLGVDGSQLKNTAAVTAERLARLKLNGQLIGYSPLSRLVELEGLAAGVETKLNLWRSLREALPEGAWPADIDLDGLIERARAQRETIEQHRQAAAATAFAGAREPRDRS